jgi:hypothetical protein
MKKHKLKIDFPIFRVLLYFVIARQNLNWQKLNQSGRENTLPLD